MGWFFIFPVGERRSRHGDDAAHHGARAGHDGEQAGGDRARPGAEDRDALAVALADEGINVDSILGKVKQFLYFLEFVHGSVQPHLEGVDVVVDPLEGHGHVQQAVVARGVVVARRQEAQRTQPEMGWNVMQCNARHPAVNGMALRILGAKLIAN